MTIKIDVKNDMSAHACFQFECFNNDDDDDEGEEKISRVGWSAPTKSLHCGKINLCVRSESLKFNEFRLITL